MSKDEGYKDTFKANNHNLNCRMPKLDSLRDCDDSSSRSLASDRCRLQFQPQRGVRYRMDFDYDCMALLIIVTVGFAVTLVLNYYCYSSCRRNAKLSKCSAFGHKPECKQYIDSCPDTLPFFPATSPTCPSGSMRVCFSWSAS